MQKKKLHFFLTRDMKTFVCKEPRKAKVLEDYVVRAKNIKDLIEGYQDTSDSPFIESKGFFERSIFLNLINPEPDEACCFQIIGPVSRYGRKNLYFICDTPLEANRWVEYIELIREYHRRQKEKNLGSSNRRKTSGSRNTRGTSRNRK
jgi:hypothetical protein